MDRCYERYAATVAVAGMLAGGWTLLPAAATHHSSAHSSSLQRPGHTAHSTVATFHAGGWPDTYQ